MGKPRVVYRSEIMGLSDLFVETYLKLEDGMSQPENINIEHLSPQRQKEYLAEVSSMREWIYQTL